MAKAEKKGVKILLPTDFVTGDKFSKDANVSVNNNNSNNIKHNTTKLTRV